MPVVHSSRCVRQRNTFTCYLMRCCHSDNRVAAPGTVGTSDGPITTFEPPHADQQEQEAEADACMHVYATRRHESALPGRTHP